MRDNWGSCPEPSLLSVGKSMPFSEMLVKFVGFVSGLGIVYSGPAQLYLERIVYQQLRVQNQAVTTVYSIFFFLN